MSQRGKRWLWQITKGGDTVNFFVTKKDRGTAMSLAALGYIRQTEDGYFSLAESGKRWIATLD